MWLLAVFNGLKRILKNEKKYQKSPINACFLGIYKAFGFGGEGEI
jgi:hypothetical protein